MEIPNNTPPNWRLRYLVICDVHMYPPRYTQSLAGTPGNSVSSTDLSHHLPTTCAGQAISDELQRVGTKDEQ